MHIPQHYKPNLKATTIRISRKTKETLTEFARYGDSMDKVINNIIRTNDVYRDQIKKHLEEKTNTQSEDKVENSEIFWN